MTRIVLNIFLTVFTFIILEGQVQANCDAVMDFRFREPTWGDLGDLRRLEKAAKSGCNFNKKNKCSLTNMKVPVGALSCAVAYGQTKSVEKLLDENVDVNEKDSSGNTALSYAVKNNDIQIVKLLMSHGADYKNIISKVQEDPKTATNTSLNAVTVMLLKEKDNFDVCKYSYDQVSDLFFISQALNNTGTSDRNLRRFTKLLKTYSNESEYQSAKEKCLFAKTYGSKGVMPNGSK